MRTQNPQKVFPAQFHRDLSWPNTIQRFYLWLRNEEIVPVKFAEGTVLVKRKQW